MQNAEKLIEEFLKECTNPDGSFPSERFRKTSDAEEKITEFRVLLNTVTLGSEYLVDKFDNDPVLQFGGLEERLSMLIVYVKTTLKLLKNDVIRYRGFLVNVPDISKLIRTNPGLETIIADRWLEIQICIKVGAHLSAIILMGSVLEALILSRAMLDADMVSRTKKAVRRGKPIQEWSLSELISAAIELGWIKVEPIKFGFALRKYRHLIHPWGETSANVDLSAETCYAYWQVLNKAIQDLLKSL